MDKLIFLNNEFLDSELRKSMHLPMTFVSFAFIEGNMYKHFRNQSTFVVPLNTKKKWGNSVVYGAIFLCKDFDFYARLLDAYHMCSMSTMLRNHNQDVHHRTRVQATPIFFNTIEELASLKYREGESIEVQTYMGNPKHPKIKQRLNKTVSYRIIDGVDAGHFKKLFREVSTWKEKY